MNVALCRNRLLKIFMQHKPFRAFKSEEKLRNEAHNIEMFYRI